MRRLLPWLPVLVWAAAIFALSAIPGSGLPPLDTPGIDKLAHAAVYSVLGALCLRAVRRSTRQGRPAAIATATGLAALYGVTDEVHQLFVPGRFAEWSDALADLAGSLLGAALATWKGRVDGVVS